LSSRWRSWWNGAAGGCLSRFTLPQWLEVPLAVLLMDYTLYVWHALSSSSNKPADRHAADSELMAKADGFAMLHGYVELDEACVGGRRPGKRGRGAAGKTIVHYVPRFRVSQARRTFAVQKPGGEGIKT